jgi:adenylate cyclase
MLHQQRREWQVAQDQEEALMALAREQGFAHLLALATILRGRTLAERGQGEEASAQMCQDIAACRAIGGELGQPYYLALLAEAYGKAGRGAEGLRVLAEALARAQQTGEHWYDAELYRLTGTLTLQSKVQSPQHPAPNT